jgi:hypothetical protein
LSNKFPVISSDLFNAAHKAGAVATCTTNTEPKPSPKQETQQPPQAPRRSSVQGGFHFYLQKKSLNAQTSNQPYASAQKRPVALVSENLNNDGGISEGA